MTSEVQRPHDQTRLPPRRHRSRAPALKQNPDRLLVFIDEGSIRATAAPSLSFEYAYTLRAVVTDYAQHADTLMVPILAWVAVNQPELLANPDRARDGIRFEADLLNHTSMDLEVRIALTERVVVTDNPDGTRTARHVGEPPLDPWAGVVDDWELVLPAEVAEP